MNFYGIVQLINAILYLSMGLFVYFHDRKKPLHRTFLIFCLLVSAWCICYFVWQLTTTYKQGLFWARALNIWCIFIPVTYLHHILILLGADKEKGKSRLIKGGYALSFILLAISYTPLYVKTVAQELYFPYWPKPGPFYHIYIIYFFSYLTYSWYLMIKKYILSSNEQEKQQIRYILPASIIGFMGGATNFFLFYSIPIPPIGNILCVVYPIAISYVILRHKLFGINVIIKKGLVYSILAAVVTAIFFTILLITEKFFQGLVGYQSLIITATVGFIITLGFNPLKNQLQRFIDRLFFKGTVEEIAYQNERLMQQIQGADKLKAVATLAAGMAHEIKNPLTAIRTFSQYMPKKYSDPDFINKYKKIVPREIERINRIVGDVLQFSKPKQPNFKEVNINNLLSDTLDFLSNDFLNKNIKVVTQFSANHAITSADPDQLKQVFLNLFLNAIDAMPKGGHLTISSKVNADSRKSNADARKLSDGSTCDHSRVISDNPRSIEISIQDTGCGISQDNRKHLFEPFHTTKTTGTGLGLAVVHGIIKNHHAQIKVESEVGKGTRFVIKFPGVGKID